MGSKLSALLLIVGVGLGSIGCDLIKKKVSKDEKTAKADEDEDDAPTKTATAAPTQSAAAQPAGQFVYLYDPPASAALKLYEPLFKAGSRLETVAGAMNVYALPRKVPVVAGECGRIDASYSPSKHAITLCVELADAFYKNFLAGGRDDPTASKLTLDALTFTLLHEMGHALVQELELGVTGGEEDAVDDLAALILIQNKKAEWAIAGTQALIELTKGQKPQFFDEHSFSEQRLGNVLCMVLGSDPNKHMGLLDQIPDLKPRAPKCPKEYQQKDKAWTQLLEPHLRK